MNPKALAEPHNSGSEGIVHGHIHKYNSITYIHGHVHRTQENAQVKKSGAVGTLPENHMGCQHFEFVNVNDGQQQRESVDEGQLPEDGDTSFSKLHTFSDDLIVEPLKKKRRASSTGSKSDRKNECYCNPRVLEVCCDVDHDAFGSTIEGNNASSDSITNGEADHLSLTGEEINIYTALNSTNSGMLNANEMLYNHLGNGAVYDIPELDCNLTCDFLSNSKHRHPCDVDIDIKNPDFGCAFDESRTLNPSYNEQNLDKIKGKGPSGQLTPITNTNSPSKVMNECHDHIVNSETDLKILEELCNISKLYDFPFTKHTNHNMHAEKRIPNTESSINLLKETMKCEGNTLFKKENNQSLHHTHHHHALQLHPHEPILIENLENYDDQSTINQYSYERHRNSQKMKVKEKDTKAIIHHHVYHRDHQPVNDLSGIESFRNTEYTDPNSTIHFNWSFKEEGKSSESQINCEWMNCFEQFPTLLDLQKHMIEYHIAEDQAESSNTDCNWKDCKTKCDDICSLINHVNSAHGINFDIRFMDPKTSTSDMQQGYGILSTTSNIYTCQWETCSHKFENIEDLTEHITNEHIPKGKSNYTCSWANCNKTFCQRQKLVRHLNVHTKYKPYKCSHCGRKFSAEETLKQHIRTHTGEKPFQCKICGKYFTKASSVATHSRLHTGNKPLKCNICGKTFNESSNLRRHLASHQKKKELCKLPSNIISS